ncbi:MAG TPA: hypothetical protein VMU54_22750 [Planctomycetota bacterium]|nr:hypothetical protein [Planctomycetota bacterium]
MENPWSELLAEIVRWMSGGEAPRAQEVLARLEADLKTSSGAPGLSLESLREPFLGLLKRRGYFIGAAEINRLALEEVLEMGPGFDLYDLSAAIARCDQVLAGPLQTPSPRAFPELRPFSPGLGGMGNQQSPGI